MSDRRDVFEDLILRSMGTNRFTQDSPVLPDVWIGYGMQPGKPQQLLLIPDRESSSDVLAKQLRGRLEKHLRRTAKVAHHQNAVAACLSFDDLIQVVLPMSNWWRSTLIQGEGADEFRWFHEDREGFRRLLTSALQTKNFENWQAQHEDERAKDLTLGLVWLARIVGSIARTIRLWPDMEKRLAVEGRESEADKAEALRRLIKDERLVVEALFELLEGVVPPKENGPPPLWTINRNRSTEVSVYRSNKAIKADAARQLFDVRGSKIRWAVIDSGIDATHMAFRRRDAAGQAKDLPKNRDWTKQSRIVATYDFTKLRDLLSADEDSLEGIPPEMEKKASALGLKTDLKKALKFGSMIDWDLFEKFLRVDHDADYKKPGHFHGTHVAGILGADWRADEHNLYPLVDRTGIAPEIEIFDLRALDEDGRGDEFSVMAALQFARHLNQRRTSPNQMQVHGVNLSLAIRHEVSNYACGRTPVCDEAERLVGAGIVVVAAAGNHGRARYRTSTGLDDEGYRSISITDPGNAEMVITVGATHSSSPHTYGVSYFSSRGPTGDGRRKPDLVAPGEKIYSTAPGDNEKNADGTSQAAPHVSGAAALLLERHRELVGQPRKVKEILCGSATDLGREPYFQGAGMLDILRAMQCV